MKSHPHVATHMTDMVGSAGCARYTGGMIEFHNNAIGALYSLAGSLVRKSLP
ncbi:hypothetical protein [Chromohalobacter israelensis]|uniref:hypothetical protein n=1 Tax=Chromohalobacter israelensis TaxID=141390 RepID=UPI003D7B215B